MQTTERPVDYIAADSQRETPATSVIQDSAAPHTEPENPAPVVATTPRRRPAWLIDLAIAMVILIAGALVGAVDSSQWSVPGSFYREEFGPAVMQACGRGFVNPPRRGSSYLLKNAPSLQNFLNFKQDSLSCSDLPADMPTTSPTSYQGEERYLMMAAGLLWALGGVSWAGLLPLFALLYGASVAASYGLFRFGMGRVLAAACAAVFCFSVIHLALLNQLRDYSKAPFILASLFIMCLMVRKSLTKWQLVGLGALMGAIVGIGVGFRTDVLVVAYIFPLVALFLLPGKFLRTIFWRGLTLVSFMGLMVLTGLPIFSALGGGTNTFHVMLMGLSKPFDGAMGLQSDLYDTGYMFADRQAYSIFYSYNYSAHGATRAISLGTAAYQQLSSEYVVRLLTIFPSDYVLGVYASVLRIFELPFNGMATHFYLDPQRQAIDPQKEVIDLVQPDILGFYRSFEAAAIERFSGIAIICAVIALFLVTRRSLRRGLFALLVVLALCAYMSLQFSTRHYFELEVFPIWALGFILHEIVLLVRRTDFATLRERVAALRSGTVRAGELIARSQIWRSREMRLALLAFAAGIVVLVGSLLGLRLYQQQSVGALLDRYWNADLEQLQVSTSATKQANRVLVKPAGFPQPDPQPTGGAKKPQYYDEYLVAEFSEQIPQGFMPVTFRYVATNTTSASLAKVWDHSRSYSLEGREPAAQGGPETITRIYFPAYNTPYTTFQGIEMNKEQLPLLKGLYRVKNSSQFPLLLWLNLPSNWRATPAYKQLVPLESPNVDTSPAGLNLAAVGGDFVPLAFNTINAHSPIVDLAGGHINIDGKVTAAKTLLVGFKQQPVKEGDYLVAEGEMHWGCLELLLSQGYWYVPTTVRQPGPFKLVIRVPESMSGKSASVSIRNRDATCRGDNSFRIDKLGWYKNTAP